MAPKQSTIEKKLNTIIIYILIIVFILCIACTILGADFRGRNKPDYESGDIAGDYIFYYNPDPLKNKSISSDTLEVVRIFAGLFTIFNTLIPISIMITGEIIKTFQVNLIEIDKQMKKDPEDQFRILSTKLHEDLGNVRYIFSDKTGTLTKNEMSFRACTIFAQTFGEIDEESPEENHHPINHKESINNNFSAKNSHRNISPRNLTNKKTVKKSILASSFNKEVIQHAIEEGGILNIKNLEESPIKNMGEACKEFFFNITLNHNVLVELDEEEDKNNNKGNKENHLTNNKNFNDKKTSLPSKNLMDSSRPILEKMEEKNSTPNNNIRHSENLKTNNINNLHSNLLNNNTNINKLNEDNESTFNKQENHLTYQGSNPDEIVLVTAASEIGVSFIEQDKEYLHIKFFNEDLRFKVLHKFEFSSERKRSSIIVEDEKGIIKIYVKGSDEKILSENNINTFSKKCLLKDTKDQLDSFARIGLRTLCFAYKEIPKDRYQKWEKEYEKLKQECIIDKSKNSKLEKFIAKMEEDLILIGATALEDKLQDNVKIDLQEFIDGGISFWMITGDKLDTAESIGHSCRLFNDDTEVFKIKSSDKKTTK